MSISGQGMTEYLIIVALMAISAIAIMRSTSSSMKAGFGKISSALQGKTYSGKEGESVKDDMVDGKNLGNFADDVKSGE